MIEKNPTGRMIKNIANDSREKIYVIEHKIQSKPIKLKLLNETEVFANGSPKIFSPPNMRIRGFRPYPVVPSLFLDTRLGRKPRDIEEKGAYWLISNRAKEIFSQFSDIDFSFMELDIVSDREQEKEKYWLCDVITVSDAIDIKKSHAKVEKGDSGEDVIQFGSISKLHVNKSIFLNHRIFRSASNVYVIVCDNRFKEVIQYEKLTGLNFRDVTAL